MKVFLIGIYILLVVVALLGILYTYGIYPFIYASLGIWSLLMLFDAMVDAMEQ